MTKQFLKAHIKTLNQFHNNKIKKNCFIKILKILYFQIIKIKINWNNNNSHHFKKHNNYKNKIYNHLYKIYNNNNSNKNLNNNNNLKNKINC